MARNIDPWDKIFTSDEMKAVEAFNAEEDNPNAKAVGFNENSEGIVLIIATKDHDTRIELQSKYGKEYRGYSLRFDVLGGEPQTTWAHSIRMGAQWVRDLMGF